MHAHQTINFSLSPFFCPPPFLVLHGSTRNSLLITLSLLQSVSVLHHSTALYTLFGMRSLFVVVCIESTTSLFLFLFLSHQLQGSLCTFRLVSFGRPHFLCLSDLCLSHFLLPPPPPLSLSLSLSSSLDLPITPVDFFSMTSDPVGTVS